MDMVNAIMEWGDVGNFGELMSTMADLSGLAGAKNMDKNAGEQ